MRYSEIANEIGMRKNVRVKPILEKTYAMDNSEDPTIWDINVKDVDVEEFSSLSFFALDLARPWSS